VDMLKRCREMRPDVPVIRIKAFGNMKQAIEAQKMVPAHGADAPRRGRGQGPGLPHQGAIWVEDNPGGGSIFYVLLPMDSVGQPAVSVSAARSSARGDLSPPPS